MSFSAVGNQEDITVGTSPMTISVDIGTRTNGLLVVCVSGLVSNVLTLTATYNGVALDSAVYYRIASGQFSQILYLTNPSNGANDLVLTWTIASGGTFTYKHTLISWWDGAHQTQASVLDQVNSGDGSTDPSLTITPTEDNELIISQYMSRANDVLTPEGSGISINDWDQGGNVMGGSYVIQTTAGLETISFSGADEIWTMALASFKQAASAAAASLFLSRRRNTLIRM